MKTTRKYIYPPEKLQTEFLDKAIETGEKMKKRTSEMQKELESIIETLREMKEESDTTD